MGQASQNLRNIVSLARMLRNLANQHTRDRSYDQFLSTAVELEAQAHHLAAAGQGQELERDVALHAPVNLVI